MSYDVFYPTTTGGYIDFEEGYIYYALNCSLSTIGYVPSAEQSGKVNSGEYIRGIGDIESSACSNYDSFIGHAIGDNQSSALSTFYLKDGCILMLCTPASDATNYGDSWLAATMFASTLPNGSTKQALVWSEIISTNGQATAWGIPLQFVPYNTSTAIVVRIKLKK